MAFHIRGRKLREISDWPRVSWQKWWSQESKAGHFWLWNLLFPLLAPEPGPMPPRSIPTARSPSSMGLYFNPIFEAPLFSLYYSPASSLLASLR